MRLRVNKLTSISETNFDVIIIGGGPAGLSAAMVLGRCRRKVLVCDNGGQRNRHSEALHGYLTRDGINPNEFLRKAYEELVKYNILILRTTITNINQYENGFQVTQDTGLVLNAKKILLATGISDILPDIPGIMNYYGKSIFHCPYCDGWEVSDKAIAVYSKGGSFQLALSMKTWSNDVILLTDGFTKISQKWKQRLSSAGIDIIKSRITGLKGDNHLLKEIEFLNRSSIKRDVIFFSTGYRQNSVFAESLGCNLSKKGTVLFDKKQRTNIKGVFVAGDASMDMKFVIVAAAEGAKAGVAINIALQEEEMLNTAYVAEQAI